MTNHVLLISCADERGLVNRVTGCLLRHSLNVVENDEYVDRRSATFFMRTDLEGDVDPERLLDCLRQSLPEGASIELRDRSPRRLVLYATREPHCLGDLLLRHDAGELRARVLAVVSQYDVLRRLVERFEIPFHHIPADQCTRGEHEQSLLAATEPYRPDYLVLAKYMRVLSPDFVARFPNRILNIHHSFLPAFVGSNPYRQAYERGVKIIGATAHYVNEELDEGPIIAQSVIPVSHTQDAANMARSGRDIERSVLARALNLVLEDRVLVVGRRTLVFE